VPRGVGVFKEESVSESGECSSSASGLNGLCSWTCFGASEVLPESTEDAIVGFVSLSVGADRDDCDLLMLELLETESSSTIGLILVADRLEDAL